MEVVAVSTDLEVDALLMAGLVGAEFPILPDPGGRLVRTYGVFDLLGDRVAAPATIIIGKDRSILWSQISRTVGGRPTADDILRQLDELGVPAG